MIERIKNLITVKNLSASGLAAEIGVQRSSVSHILSGRNKASLDFVLKLKESFTDLNLDWLLYGKGEMFVRDTKIGLKPKPDSVAETNVESKSDSMPEFSFENSKKQTDDLFSADKKIDNTLKNEHQNVIEEPNVARSEDIAYYGPKSKKLIKVVLFYDDKSFEEFNPKK